jgi:CelD/BcsL family acetyltransferase involved in cellulose biosynthesis
MVTEIPLSSISPGARREDCWAGDGRRAWDALFHGAPGFSPFLSTVWTAEWLREFATALRPVQLLFADLDGRTIGTCLLTRRSVQAGPLSLRRAFFNTDGENPGDSVVIEHNALLSAPGRETDVARQLASYVDTTNIDEFVLSGLGEDEVNRFREAFSHWVFDVEWRDSPYVDLSQLRSAGRTHLDALSANTRAQLRRAMRLYSERGELKVEVADTAAAADSMLAELIELHEARWHAKGQRGAFGSAQRRRFLEGFAQAGVASGESALLRVTSGSRTIGVAFFLVANGRANFYQAGFAYEAHPTLKPGLVTHHLAIEHFRQHGDLEYDFLVSGPNEGRYKLSLATDVRRLGWVTLSRRGVRHSVFSLARRTRHVFGRSNSTAGKLGGSATSPPF